MFEIKDINKNHKIYNAKVYIDKDKIVFEIESESIKYSNQYDLKKLQEFKYFKQSDELNEELDYFKDLFDGNFVIEHKGNNIELNFPQKRETIKFLLIEINDNKDIKYENLSEEMKKIIDNNELILGIDLGTTYSCAAVMIDKNIIVIRNSLGSTTTPSFINFINKNEVYVGELAKLLPSNVKNIIYNTKRIIGKSLDEEEIKEMILKKNLPFNFKKDNERDLLKIVLDFRSDEEKDESVSSNISGNSKSKSKKEEKQEENSDDIEDFYPEQICSLILKKIIKDSEYYLTKKIGKEIKIKDCVITIPAYFNQKQREATMNSAKILGLNVKTMINEPTAASLAYAYDSIGNEDKHIIVIDFGGGTLDITSLRYKKNEEGTYCDVKKTYGDTNFGGEDFDKILMAKCKEWLLTQITKDQSLNLDKIHNVRLKRACERAKIKLTDLKETNIHLENYLEYKTFNFGVTRKEFDYYCRDLYAKFEKVIDNFMQKEGDEKSDISEVILIGGSTLIPRIKEIVKEKFKNSKINDKINPKEVVAMGAAIRAAKFFNFQNAKDIKLFDVTNLSLGVREKGDKFGRLIKRSTRLPCSKIKNFKTVCDNQKTVSIQVYEGEGDDKCRDNNLFLGKFEITGLPKKKAGEVKIQVKFEIMDNSILEVTAWEEDNKSNKNNIIIEKSYDLDMNYLRERDSQIILVEDYGYNNIKFSIIESEENIEKLKSEKIKNIESIKSENKKVIENIGNFLVNPNKYQNLYISFIKYYFNKLCQYYQSNEINDKDLNDLSKIQKNLDLIFINITSINADLIFEIIEEFVDLDKIYKQFIDFILTSYYNKINLIFFSSTSVMKDKKTDLYEKTIKELSEATNLLGICIELINQFDMDRKNSMLLGISDLENYKLKIMVRRKIIKVRNTSFLKKIFTSDKTELNNLYTKYSQCDFFEIEDLQELKSLIGIKEQRANSNTNEENEATDKETMDCLTLMEWIETKIIKNRNDITQSITKILTEFPYCGKEKEDKMWDEFEKFKGFQISLDNYLLSLKGKYEDYKFDGKLSEIKKTLCDTILAFLNKLG